jgi:hypothetical protein
MSNCSIPSLICLQGIRNPTAEVKPLLMRTNSQSKSERTTEGEGEIGFYHQRERKVGSHHHQGLQLHWHRALAHLFKQEYSLKRALMD